MNQSVITVGYYPGCSLGSGARDYDESVRAVSRAANIDLFELPDWNCCGATAAHSVNRDLSLALPARNLALAREAGLDAIFAPCAACSNRLQAAHVELSTHEDVRRHVESIIERTYDGALRVINGLQFATETLLPRLALPADALAGIRLAPYYGCLLVRPPKVVDFDDPEDPTSMDEALRSLGATVVDWEYKVECCGAAHSLAKTDIVVNLTGRILAAAREAGAHGVVTACPMCHSNLDLRQLDIMRHEGHGNAMPAYYLTQIIGLAAGLDEAALGINRHFVKATGLLGRRVGA